MSDQQKDQNNEADTLVKKLYYITLGLTVAFTGGAYVIITFFNN